MTKDQLNNFKDIVKNHILENIILGIQGGLQERAAPKHLYDKNLGFGEPPVAPVIDEKKEADKKKAESNISYMGRHTKTFFSFKTQGLDSQISIKDPNAEALVLEGLVLGHPDILRKFNITMKQDELEKQCKVEKVFKGTNEDNNCTFDFAELAPEVFYMIRRIQNVSETLIKNAFSQENLENIQVSVSPNKGGSFYIKPEQGGLIIQSINKASFKLIQNFLPEYYKYLLMNPNTHLIPILGVYTLTIHKGNNSALPLYFVIQRHIRSFDLKSLESDDLVFNFDIKGNLGQNRKILENPREILKLDVSILKQQMYKNTSLKDQDFLQSFKKLEITQSQAEKIISQLEQDVEVLNKNGFIDYSLFMIVVLRPFKHVEHFKPSTLGTSAFDDMRTIPDE
jgi:hypothetical protein